MHIKKKITILIMLTNCFRKVLIFFNKVIFIYEIISRIIWWININHLHFAQVCFAQKLQGIEVIALDVDIFTINVPPRCTIAADGLFPVQPQGLGNGLIRQNDSLTFIGPGKLIPLLAVVYNGRIDFLHQYVFIDGTDDMPLFIQSFRDGIRKQRCQFPVIFRSQVRCLHLKLFHVRFPPFAVYMLVVLYIG